MATIEQKLEQLAQTITRDQQQELTRCKLDCESNMNNAVAHVHYGKRYARVDVGGSGKYMIELDTERIYGIKAYGVIHRGHYYGTLDTIGEYFWGRYAAVRMPHA